MRMKLRGNKWLVDLLQCLWEEREREREREETNTSLFGHGNLNHIISFILC